MVTIASSGPRSVSSLTSIDEAPWLSATKSRKKRPSAENPLNAYVPLPSPTNAESPFTDPISLAASSASNQEV